MMCKSLMYISLVIPVELLEKSFRTDIPEYWLLFVCLCVDLRPLENFSFIWRCHHYCWRALNFDLCSALMANKQYHTNCDTGHPVIMVIMVKDPWHLHLLPSTWQWSCYYLYKQLRSVATQDLSSISRMRGKCSTNEPLQRALDEC